MTDFFTLITLYQLVGYGIVSVGQLGAGWAIMWALHQRRGVSLWWAFVLQSLVIGFAGFLIRKTWVFGS